MIQSLRNSIIYISGAEPTFTLEHRLFNLSSCCITVFAVIVSWLNYAIGLEPETAWLGLIGAVASFTFFYFSRFKGHISLRMVLAYISLTLIILSIIYFYNGGMSGTTIYVFMMMLNIFTFIMPPRHQYWALGLFYSCILILVLLEYYYPNMVFPYHSREEKLIDFITGLLYTMFFPVVIIGFSRNSYFRERDKVICQNNELKQLNKQIDEQRKTLEEAVLLANKRRDEIETLLNELNHRVKNNLQVVSSLLKLQAQSVSDEKAKYAILESKNRLSSMILVHKRLYLNENATQIFMPEYLQELSESVMRSFNGTLDEETVSYSIEPVWLQVEKAISVGMISNELITNCFKHAIQPNTGGKIAVKLSKTGEQHLLTVSDNGSGLLDAEQSKNFGLKLVRSLVTQLNGSYKVSSGNGTCWEIYFN